MVTSQRMRGRKTKTTGAKVRREGGRRTGREFLIGLRNECVKRKLEGGFLIYVVLPQWPQFLLQFITIF